MSFRNDQINQRWQRRMRVVEWKPPPEVVAAGAAKRQAAAAAQQQQQPSSSRVNVNSPRQNQLASWTELPAGTLATARVAPLPPGAYNPLSGEGLPRYQMQPLPPAMPAPPAPRYQLPQQQGPRVPAVNVEGLAYGLTHQESPRAMRGAYGDMVAAEQQAACFQVRRFPREMRRSRLSFAGTNCTPASFWARRLFAFSMCLVI